MDYIPNLPVTDRQALHSLRRRLDIVIKPADKNVGIVAIDVNVYESKSLQQLNNTEFYRRLDYNPNRKTFNLMKSQLEQLLNNKQINKTIHNSIIPKYAGLGTFYILPKIHKPHSPGRPIISNVQHSTHRLSKYLSKILSPFIPVLSNIASTDYNIPHY
ncbi:unnamed protein product, partial [Didymodactylos carnosus]